MSEFEGVPLHFKFATLLPPPPPPPQNLPALVLKIMQGSAALEPLEARYSRGQRDLIYSLLQRNPDDRPDVHLVMANPFVVNALMNLVTDIGRLPCTRCVCVRERERERVCVCVCVHVSHIQCV